MTGPYVHHQVRDKQPRYHAGTERKSIRQKMARLLAQRGSRMAQVFAVLMFMYIGRAAGALMYYVMEPVRQEAD